MRVFDRREDALIVERRLPHWAQSGTICFITFRTRDSMPKSVVDRWLRERWQWLRSHGIDPAEANWHQGLEQLDQQLQHEFHRTFSQFWHDELDQCHGECVLRQPELAQIVANSLKYFAGDRYELTDFVVMPNHVHLLAAFREPEHMLEQCESWKHFTATQINRRLKRKGKLWQQDGFDHLVRNVDEFEHLRRYIAENPAKARIGPTEYVHESKPQ